MKKIIFTIAILLLINSCNTINYAKTLKKKPNNLEKVLNKYADTLNSLKYGVVALHKKNNIVEKAAIGMASESIKMTTNKIFNIGSLTKLFTAVLIMQEVEKENISLTDTIGTFFPKELIFNKNVDTKITIENLLKHKSGLGEVIVDTIVNKALDNPYHKYNNTLLYNKIPKSQFKRGERYKYTNTNYILLGYILEVINNLPYGEIVRNRIFTPCKMENSYPYYSTAIKNTAYPMYKGNEYYPFYNYYQDYAFSAGGISSNLNDLQSFFINLYERNTLISRASFQQMINFENDKYGLGIEKIILGKNNDLYLGHGGDNFSFKVRNYYKPKTKELLIIMANNWLDPYCQKIKKDILGN